MFSIYKEGIFSEKGLVHLKNQHHQLEDELADLEFVQLSNGE